MTEVTEKQKQKLKSVNKYTCKLKQDTFGSITGEEVKTLAYVTSFNEDEMVTKEVRYDSNGKIEEIHDYVYDQHKKVIEHHWSMPQDGVEESERMERDENGRLLREVKLYGEEEGESINYFYDEKDNVKTAEYKDEEGELTLKEEFEYTENKTLLFRKTTDFVEGKSKSFKFIYNDNKKLAEMHEFDTDGNLVTITKYVQDDKDNDVSIVQYNNKNEITQRVSSTYDESGKKLKRIARGFFTRISDYEYDDHGNLLNETTTDENGVIINRNSFEFDENHKIVFETYYEIDLTHSGRDTNNANRYEYVFY